MFLALGPDPRLKSWASPQRKKIRNFHRVRSEDFGHLSSGLPHQPDRARDSSERDSDVSLLASLRSMTSLDLAGNEISDIGLLVVKNRLGSGDRVLLQVNNLDLLEGSEDLENIRPLEARGVVVHY